MITRYSVSEIAEIFADQSRLERWLEVELLACEGWARLGKVPTDVLPKLKKARIDVDRIAQLEAEQGHDLAAFVSAVQETLGPEGRYLHYGLTSSDVVDTALATQLRDAAQIIQTDLEVLVETLANQALEHHHTIMVGRTHGVHAEPLTLGIKLANHYDEIKRAQQRLIVATAEIAVGQISGAVGTHAIVPIAVEEHVCNALGLQAAPVATQVVARDRHAAFLNAIALVGGVLERLATTVRLLQQTEIGELEEPFSSKQKGSSAMPHKRNPILSERMCGLSRILRGYSVVGMENIALWHERDISHSSAERVILPDACNVLAYMIRLASKVVNGLHVNTDRMEQNLGFGGGLVFSQQVLSALIDKGNWSREKAYRTVQQLAAKNRSPNGNFRRAVEESEEITEALGIEDLQSCFEVDYYLKAIDATFERLGLSLVGGGQWQLMRS